jgi:hypothetical protein
MPWINLTVRKGAIPKSVQHALMAKLTEVLMWWEKVPETPRARSIMKGWIYEVAEDADYSGGSQVHEKPYYFIEIRIPINRLDLLAKQGLIRDFTHRPGGGEVGKYAGKCSPRLGVHQRTQGRGLGHRRTYRLAARLHQRPRCGR